MRRLASIITFLLGGAYIAALFNYSSFINDFTYNGLYDGKYGFDLIMELVDAIKGGTFAFGVETTFAPILVAAGAVFALITAILGVIGIFTQRGGLKGMNVLAVVTTVIDVTLLIVVLAVNKAEATGYGLYIFLALAVLMIIFGMIAKLGAGRRSHGGGHGPQGGGFGGPRGGNYGGPRGGGNFGGPRGGRRW